MHLCFWTTSKYNQKLNKGNAQLVVDVLQENYHGVLETPAPKALIYVVLVKVAVKMSYSAALKGKYKVVVVVCGSPQEIYKMLYFYLTS